jgi:hypothetical protein
VAHIDFAHVRLGIRGELLEAACREILADGEQLRLFGEQPDGLEILLRVVTEIV